MKRSLFHLAPFALALLTACGGGGSIDPAGNSAPVSGVISGTATKGPVAGATVTAHAVSAGRIGEAIAQATTDTNGNFMLTLGTHAGALVLKVSGGRYVDEATGSAMALAPGDMMTAALPDLAAGASTQGVQVTPVTAMAQAMAEHRAEGMTSANIAEANAALGRYFAVADILHTHPMNPLMAGAGAGAGADERNYGMTLAAMSQYAKSLALQDASGLVTAMMSDAADGVLDGKADGHPIGMGPSGHAGGMMNDGMMSASAGSAGLSAAMSAYMASPLHASGLQPADMASLMHKLAGSDGHL